MGWYIYTGLDDPSTKLSVVRDDAAIIHHHPPMWCKTMHSGNEHRQCVAVVGVEVARTDRQVLCAVTQVTHFDDWALVTSRLNGEIEVDRCRGWWLGQFPPVPRDMQDLPELPIPPFGTPT